MEYDPLTARKLLADNLAAAMKIPGRPEISQQELARRASKHDVPNLRCSRVD